MTKNCSPQLLNLGELPEMAKPYPGFSEPLICRRSVCIEGGSPGQMTSCCTVCPPLGRRRRLYVSGVSTSPPWDCHSVGGSGVLSTEPGEKKKRQKKKNQIRCWSVAHWIRGGLRFYAKENILLTIKTLTTLSTNIRMKDTTFHQLLYIYHVYWLKRPRVTP